MLPNDTRSNDDDVFGCFIGQLIRTLLFIRESLVNVLKMLLSSRLNNVARSNEIFNSCHVSCFCPH